MATLLAILEEVAEGRGTESALPDAIATVRTELEETRTDFTATAERLPAHVRDAVQTFIRDALGNLDDYGQALAVTEDFVRSRNPHTLQQALEQVRRCMTATSRGFDAFRDAVLVVTGPTDIPNLNLMLQAYEELLNGAAPPEKLMVLAERERRRSNAELERLHGLGTGQVKVVALARGWQEHQECMTDLIDAVKAQDRTQVEALLKDAQETFSDLRRLIPAAQEALDSEGPSPSPLVNIVFNLGRGLSSGSVPEGAFVRAVSTLKDNINATSSQLEVLAGLGDDPSLEGPLQQVRAAIAQYGAGFATIDRFLQNRRLSTLEEGLKSLDAASKDVQHLQQQLLERAEKAHKRTVTCIRCGHENPSGRMRCERCPTNLPVSDQAPTSLREFGESGNSTEPAAETLILSTTLHRVYTAINGAADGSVTTESYLSTLDWFEELLQTEAAALPGEFTPEQVDMVVAGLERFHNAIAELRRFGDSEDKHHLVEGGRMCNDAAHLLTQVTQPPPAPRRVVVRVRDDEDSEDIVG